jgi:hypothetical protein
MVQLEDVPEQPWGGDDAALSHGLAAAARAAGRGGPRSGKRARMIREAMALAPPTSRGGLYRATKPQRWGPLLGAAAS